MPSPSSQPANHRSLPSLEEALQDTVRWLERAVIGLNLCPFAKSVHVKGLVHVVANHGVDPTELLAWTRSELFDLKAMPESARETTLLVMPCAMADFLDFNDFVGEADGLLSELGMEGEFQIASFHPDFQFAGTTADDITNFTNRSPYPTLHLLRESSIDRAVAVFPEAEAIYETNMETLRRLGHTGWQALDVGAHP